MHAGFAGDRSTDWRTATRPTINALVPAFTAPGDALGLRGAVHWPGKRRSGEMADAADSKSAGATRGSSNLPSGTTSSLTYYSLTNGSVLQH